MAFDVNHLLVSVCDGEEHTPAACGRFSRDCDGKVMVERVRDERLSEPAYVGIRAEAIGRVTLEAGNEGHRRREGNPDQLGQVQGPLRTRICRGNR